MSERSIGSLLDSAVRTAVVRLADSKVDRNVPRPPDPVDRSRVDFLYYDGSPPSYDYEYYNDYNDISRGKEPSEPPPHWLTSFNSPDTRWEQPQTAQKTWRPPRPVNRPTATAAEPWQQPANTDRLDEAGGLMGPIARVGEVLLGGAGLLPGLLAIPIMAAASYYLLVVNAPTPVVHERMVEGASNLLKLSLEAVQRFLNPEEAVQKELIQ